MKNNTENTLKRAEKSQIILIGEGTLVGIAGGLVVLLYRILLEYAGLWLHQILDFVKNSPFLIAGWFAILILLAIVVGKLLTWEPLISGSGIPQLEGEMTGQLDQVWWKVLSAKFVGGFLCLLGGMSLGREGPSIQLGAMTGKGISKILDLRRQRGIIRRLSCAPCRRYVLSGRSTQEFFCICTVISYGSFSVRRLPVFHSIWYGVCIPVQHYIPPSSESLLDDCDYWRHPWSAGRILQLVYPKGSVSIQ